MPEQESLPQSPFEQAVDYFRQLETNLGRNCEVREMIGSATADGLPNIEVFEHPRSMNEKGRHWFTADPGAAEELSAAALDDLPRHRREKPRQRNTVLLSRSWIVNTYALAAQKPTELVKLINFASEIGEDGVGPQDIHLTPAVHTLVVKSLDFLDDPQDLRAILEAFKAESAADYKRKQMSFALGKLLIGNMLGRYSQAAVQAMDKTRLLQGIVAFDNAELIDNSFWPRFGLQAGGAIKTPAFLPLLHKKFKSLDESWLLETPLTPEQLTGEYVTQLLRAATEDPLRNTPRARRILRQTQILPRSDTNVHWQKLIDESNRLAEGYNRTGATDDRLPFLDSQNLAHTSDAFLRLMAVTRRTGLTPSQRAVQFEQDMLHAEIIAMICTSSRPADRVTRADIVLQTPDASPQERAQVQQLVDAGMPLPEALRLQFGPKESQD